jgi:hypothetical protein
MLTVNIVRNRKKKRQMTIKTALHRLRDCQHLPIPMITLVMLVAYIPHSTLRITFDLFIEVINGIASRLSLTS